MPNPNNIWFLSQKPRAAFLLVHGLNLRPATMDPLAEFLNSCGCHVLRIGLTAHNGTPEEKHGASAEIWRREVSEGYAELRKRFPYLPSGILGYSLGAALAVEYLKQQQNDLPAAAILLAPAICIQPYFNFARPFLFLRHFNCSLLSLIPAPYCAQRHTSVKMYAAALEVFDAVAAIRDMPNNVPTLALCSKRDGLVHYPAIQDWITKNRLDKWRFDPIDTSTAALKYLNHLVIDESAMGETSWREMTGNVRAFLDNSYPSQNSF